MDLIEETEDDVDLRPRRLLPALRRYDDEGVSGEGECEGRRAEPLLAVVPTRGRAEYVALEYNSGLVLDTERRGTLPSEWVRIPP